MRKLRKIVLRTLLVFTILLVGFFIYFIIAVQIDVPEIKNDTTLNWKRETIDKEFYKVNNNWLRHSKSGLWELYVEGNGYERGIANGMLTKELHEFQEDAFFHQIQLLVPDLNYLKFLKYFLANKLKCSFELKLFCSHIVTKKAEFTSRSFRSDSLSLLKYFERFFLIFSTYLFGARM